ncbi:MULTISPECIES: hypothetical protein [unclassified Streptomyces]|uniref:hypothetical protein n=1 Tax=unclassified Streptomyces TaxID=2593676 RepID=UPI0025B53B64|nr:MULTISPECIES: hypothetical protein [unclassified Streptomyces]MDN3250594.1 hypothetical protein [Streptomyces sp. ZSW22]MDN3257892.1 hypothetical protein [Streptomyces sp. MA25(2023)]
MSERASGRSRLSSAAVGPRVRRGHKAAVGATVLVALMGCTSGGAEGRSAAPGPAPTSTLLGTEDLKPLLLDASDLGKETRSLSTKKDAGDSLVLGGGPQDCEELEPYGIYGPIEKVLGTRRTAEAVFTRDGEFLTQRLYSQMPASMLGRVSKLFAVLTACPSYTELISLGDKGNAELDVTTRRVDVDVEGVAYGYERVATDRVGGSRERRMTVAVTRGWTTVLLDGSPDLVEQALRPALRKATE